MARGVRFWALVAAMGGLAVAAAGPGCSKDDDDAGGTGARAGRGGSGATSAGAGTSSGATAGEGSGETGGTAGGGATGSGAAPGSGGGMVYGETQCSDGADNDGDGAVDAMDMHCIGPLDDDEENFSTGIPGDNMDETWQDCFFDGDSGAGNDGCRYRTECLTGELSPDDEDCTVTQECLDFCTQYVPNGCDCFGCCEVYQDGEPFLINLKTCTDPTELSSCSSCIQNTDCADTCETCEICLGKTELPPECIPQGEGGAGGAPPDLPQCDTDLVPCDADQPCLQGFWCLTGCCTPAPE